MRTSRRRRLLSTVALLALLAGTPASAAKADIVPWDHVAGWEIAVDRDQNACGMRRTFQWGTTLLVMFHPQTKAASLSLGNAAWTDIRNGGEYDIAMMMDGTRWNGRFIGVNGTGRPYLFLGNIKLKFMAALMRRYRVAFYNATDGRFIAGVSLSGSAAAMTELAECQRMMNETAQPAPQRQSVQRFES